MDEVQTKMWLEIVNKTLIKEGFGQPLFGLQITKPNQDFGLVREIDDKWEMHVRGFKDGHLEPEIEVARKFIEHLDPRYRHTEPAISVLAEILDQYNIPYEITGEKTHD